MKSFAFICFFVLNLLNVLARGEDLTKESNDFLLEPNSENNSVDNEEKIIIIDTDAGSDDGVAILNLLGAENSTGKIKTALISTVFGNTNVDNVGKNILKILKTADRLNIPVFRGSNESLIRTPSYGDYYGKDGFGDFFFPDPPSTDSILRKHAAIALIEAVSENPGKLTLVCLGPLTNVALAVKLDSTFLKNLKEVFVLGGSDTGVGNVKPGVEFNFYVDPEAAFIVFKEAERVEKMLNLMTWETAFSRTKVEMEWRKNVLGTVNSTKVDLINKAEKDHLTNNPNWVSADTFLSAVVADYKTVVDSTRDCHGNVETQGDFARGALFLTHDESGQNLIKNLNVRLIKKLNAECIKSMLIENFQ